MGEVATKESERDRRKSNYSLHCGDWNWTATEMTHCQAMRSSSSSRSSCEARASLSVWTLASHSPKPPESSSCGLDAKRHCGYDVNIASCRSSHGERCASLADTDREPRPSAKREIQGRV